MTIENELEPEIWKDIIGYEGVYQISSYGNIKSLERITQGEFGNRYLKEKLLKPFKTYQGYNRVTLNLGEQKHFFVHRLVAEAFIPNPENKPFVNHINGIRDDNYYKHLEWCTQSENERHAYDVLGKSEKMPKGEKVVNSKLKNADILFIRSCEDLNHRQLAKKFNVCFQLISEIKKGTIWKHLLQEQE